jgi:hypothetical protein
MTLLNLFSPSVRACASDVSGDRSVALILFLLLGLVFAPVIGLHVAIAAAGPDLATAGPDTTARNAASPAKPARG